MSGYADSEKIQYALKTALYRTMQTAMSDSASVERSAPLRVFPTNIMKVNIIEAGKCDIDENDFGASGITVHHGIRVNDTVIVSNANGVKKCIVTGIADGDGTAEQFLQTDGAGNLTWAGSSADVSKRVMILTGIRAAGNAVDPNSGVYISNVAPSTRSALDLGSMSHAELNTKADVYVNGQLLVSGSESDRAAGNCDYCVSKHEASSELKFAFDLEAEDIVQVLVR